MDSSAFNHWSHGAIGMNGAIWLALGVPAILAWIGFGLAVLLAPHLSFDPAALQWSVYAVGTWYALLVIVFGGWVGLLLLASIV